MAAIDLIRKLTAAINALRTIEDQQRLVFDSHMLSCSAQLMDAAAAKTTHADTFDNLVSLMTRRFEPHFDAGEDFDDRFLQLLTSELSDEQWDQLSAILIAGSVMEHRELAKAVVGLLRRRYPSPLTCVLERRDAAGVALGRVPVGDAGMLVCSENIKAGTTISLYPALYLGGDDASELQRFLVKRAVESVYGRDLDDEEDSSLFASPLGDAALDAMLSYDVCSTFPAPLEGDWAAFGLPFRSPESSINDGRGSEAYVAFLEQLVRERATADAKIAMPIGKSQDREAEWHRQHASFNCRLQGITLGVFPICVVLTTRDLPAGEHEATIDYGCSYWKCRARRRGDSAESIPWLALYAAAHGMP